MKQGIFVRWLGRLRAWWAGFPMTPELEADCHPDPKAVYRVTPYRVRGVTVLTRQSVRMRELRPGDLANVEDEPDLLRVLGLPFVTRDANGRYTWTVTVVNIEREEIGLPYGEG